LVKFCILLAAYGIPSNALMYTMQRWFSPCDSATFGYFLFPECSASLGPNQVKWGIKSKAALLLNCIITFWCNVDAFGIYVFYLVSISFVMSHCLSMFIKLFGKKADEILHTGNRRWLHMYKELQLLNCYLNRIQQSVLLPLILYMCIVVFITAVFMLISRGDQLAFPELFLFSVSCIQTFLLIFVYFGFLARVYSYSNRTLGFLRDNVVPRMGKGGGLQKWGRKYVYSLHPLKISLGSVNFVDQLTPINLFNFSLSQIVSLLLLE